VTAVGAAGGTAVATAGRTARAAVLESVGVPLQMREIVLFEPSARQVVVRIVASGVCHSDLSVIRGTFPFMFPTVLGHEGSGVVESVGEAVTRVSPGDHVVLTWMPPCRECFYCLSGQSVLCEVGLAEAIGSSYATVDGVPLVRGLGVAGFATHTLVPERSVIKIPKEADLELAALVGCALSTGVGAVFRTARVAPGSSVAVVGCGGVGLSVMQGAKIAGASRIIAVDRLEAKLDLARSLGATDVVDASSDSKDAVQAVRDLTNGRGADYTFEVVGISATIEQAFAMTRRGGTCVLVGAGSPTDLVRFNAMELFLDMKTITGCVYGSTDPDRDFPALVEMIDRGVIDARKLITNRIGLDEINDALDSMEAGVGARSLVVHE
jgi:S-(hydroxymethyl)glutathione dehydrogenase / alcohol dehydrogenase